MPQLDDLRLNPTDLRAEVAALRAEVSDLRAEVLSLRLLVEGSGDVDLPLDGRINVKRAAFRLGVSVATIERHCRTGRLDAIKHAGAWRIKRTDPADRICT